MTKEGGGWGGVNKRFVRRHLRIYLSLLTQSIAAGHDVNTSVFRGRVVKEELNIKKWVYSLLTRYPQVNSKINTTMK